MIFINLIYNYKCVDFERFMKRFCYNLAYYIL